jgi:hypothetical protein
MFTGELEVLDVNELGLQYGRSLAYAIDQFVSQAWKGFTLSAEVTELKGQNDDNNEFF